MSSRPLSSRCLVSGSMSNEARPPSHEISCASRSTVAWSAAMSARTSSSPIAIVSRPIFVQFEAKMSANDGATIALKP